MLYTQKDIISKLGDKLNAAAVYQKQKEVYARPAVPEETIVTMVDGSRETQRTAREGDYVIQNMTESREEYIIEPERFYERYERTDVMDREWTVYKSKGRCKIIEVDDEILDILHADFAFTFLAEWGEEMICKEGDMLACPINDQGITAVYRIANREFAATYRPV